jgi:predicted nucleotidyltransferase
MKKRKGTAGLDTGLSPGQKAALAAVRRALKRRLGPRLVKFVLFGSRARGDYDAGSDVDLAVVVKGLGRAEKMELLDLVSAVEIERCEAVSALFMSKDEFRSLGRRGRRLARDINREGVPL